MADILNGRPEAATAMITTSWVRDEFSSGRKRLTLHAIHIPIAQTTAADLQSPISQPRMAGAPTVIGQLTLEIPNMEVARILAAGLAEMLSKQPPEIQIANKL